MNMLLADDDHLKDLGDLEVIVKVKHDYVMTKGSLNMSSVSDFLELPGFHHETL